MVADTTDLSRVSPEMLDFIASMTAIGYDTATAMEVLNYQKQRDDQNRQLEYWAAEQQYGAAIEAAQIASAASAAAAQASAAATTEAARMNADARMYDADQSLRAAQEAAAASRYSADKALEGLKISEDNKMKIAAGKLKLEAQKYASQELGSPSDWRKQVGFLRGMDMTQADITPGAIQETGGMLGPVPPELGGPVIPAPEGPTPAAPTPLAPTTPTAAPMLTTPTTRQPSASPVHVPGTRIQRGMSPAAIVGEAGPELAAMTKSGLQVNPISDYQALFLRSKGVPGMQFGGAFSKGPSYNFWGAQNKPATGYQAGYKTTFGAAPTITATPRAQAPAPQVTAPSISPVATKAPAQATPAPTGQVTIPPGEPITPIPTEPAPAAPPPAAAAPMPEPPYLEMLRSGAYIPSWQAWGGPRTNPAVGMDIPVKMPHEINYGDFLRLTPTEQQMAFADWEALGMAPDTAFEIMRRSAMRGTARAGVGYG